MGGSVKRGYFKVTSGLIMNLEWEGDWVTKTGW